MSGEVILMVSILRCAFPFPNLEDMLNISLLCRSMYVTYGCPDFISVVTDYDK